MSTDTGNYTPGPWETFGPLNFQIYGGDPQRRIAVVDRTTGADTAEHEANARLMAAAPELAAALKIALYRIDGDDTESRAARRAIGAALAKAGAPC